MYWGEILNMIFLWMEKKIKMAEDITFETQRQNCRNSSVLCFLSSTVFAPFTIMLLNRNKQTTY